MTIKRGFENRVSERPRSTERRICTETDRRERNKTTYDVKENSSQQRKTYHASKPSRSPIMYAEYKLKTARII